MRVNSASKSMRIAAYVLVADPAFLRESVAAYYPWVDRIVLSFDESSTSWSGARLPVAECLELLAPIDTEDKFVYAPGQFAAVGQPALESETRQRQAALEKAQAGADWVLQLDSDEVMLAPSAFFGALDRAASAGAAALDFPSRWLYTRVGPGVYLERSNRAGRIAASYPGALAVRAGTRLRLARQADAQHYRVDFSARNTDPWRPRDARVDEVIGADDAVAHFSWVRPASVIRKKFAWSGHADGIDASAEYERWVWRTKHYRLTAARTPFSRSSDRFRVVRIPEPPGGEPV